MSAVLDSGHHRRLEVLGRDLALHEADPSDPRVLAALADETGPSVELFPAHPGPETLCLVDASDEPRPARVTTSRSGRRRRLVVPRLSTLRRVDRRFWVLTLVIVGLVAASAVVLELITGMDPVDAIYEAMRGVIGSPTDDFLTSRTLQLMALVLTIVGAILLAAFYGLIVDVILRARITNFLGPHPTDARDHVIVVGLGTIGFRVAVDLVEQGVEVVAAEVRDDGRFSDAARSHGIAVVVTNGRSPETLRTLRIDRARAVIAATDDDAANMATALHARAARARHPGRGSAVRRRPRGAPRPFVRRLRDPQRIGAGGARVRVGRDRAHGAGHDPGRRRPGADHRQRARRAGLRRRRLVDRRGGGSGVAGRARRLPGAGRGRGRSGGVEA